MDEPLQKLKRLVKAARADLSEEQQDLLEHRLREISLLLVRAWDRNRARRQNSGISTEIEAPTRDPPDLG